MNDWKERALRAEAERDAALAEVTRADHVTDALIDRARQIGMSVRTADPSRYAGWTEDQWVADAVAIMDSIDGSCAELVNGHVHALISKAARAESAEAALARLLPGLARRRGGSLAVRPEARGMSDETTPDREEARDE